MIGLVDVETLKPGDLVGVNKVRVIKIIKFNIFKNN